MKFLRAILLLAFLVFPNNSNAAHVNCWRLAEDGNQGSAADMPNEICLQSASVQIDSFGVGKLELRGYQAEGSDETQVPLATNIPIKAIRDFSDGGTYVGQVTLVEHPEHFGKETCGAAHKGEIVIRFLAKPSDEAIAFVTDGEIQPPTFTIEGTSAAVHDRCHSRNWQKKTISFETESSKEEPPHVEVDESLNLLDEKI